MTDADLRAIVAMTSYLCPARPRRHHAAVRDELMDFLRALPEIGVEAACDLINLGDPDILRVLIAHPGRPDLAALETGTLMQNDVLDHLDLDRIPPGRRIEALDLLRPFSLRTNIYPAQMLAAFRMGDPDFGRYILDSGSEKDLLDWFSIDNVTEECAPGMAPLVTEIYARAARAGAAARPLARNLLEADHRKGVALLLKSGFDFGPVVAGQIKLWGVFADLASAHGRLDLFARLPEAGVVATMERAALRVVFNGS